MNHVVTPLGNRSVRRLYPASPGVDSNNKNGCYSLAYGDFTKHKHSPHRRTDGFISHPGSFVFGIWNGFCILKTKTTKKEGRPSDLSTLEEYGSSHNADVAAIVTVDMPHIVCTVSAASSSLACQKKAYRQS